MKTPLKRGMSTPPHRLFNRYAVIEGSKYTGSVLAFAVAAATGGILAKLPTERVALIVLIVLIAAVTVSLLQFFFFPPAELVGHGATRRRMAKQLRKAQEKCTQLLKEVEESNDVGAPIEHLQAAAQHLRMVEAWLLSESTSGEALHSPMSKTLAELQLPKDVEYSEHEAEFVEVFSPLLCREALAVCLRCLIKSGTFRHHGKLYISSARLCLHSSFLGAKIMVSCDWKDVAEVRMIDTDDSNMYHVCFNFKKEIEFDGVTVRQLDVNIFDLAAVGHLDRCATHFTGASLFGMPQEEVEEDEPFSPSSPPSTRSVPDIEAFQEPTIVWELERRSTIFHQDWKAPFLPHDGQKRFKWNAIGDSYKKHPLIPHTIIFQAVRKSEVPPIPEVYMLGGIRPCTWDVVRDQPNTDEEGWQYASDFYLSPEYWYPFGGWSNFAHVRRRKWKPFYTGPPAQRNVEPQKRKKFNSMSILEERGLTSIYRVFQGNLGKFSLEDIAIAFKDDDWTSSNSLMTRYFEAVLGATSLEVGPWVTGKGAFEKVEGSVRSVEMRISVAGKPMCPPETRCTSTWHVVLSPESVTLESALMCLDVPYGTYFNILTCDTFTLDEKFETQLVRTVGIDWVKATWLKRTIEHSVPADVGKAGQKWAEILMEWAHS